MENSCAIAPTKEYEHEWRGIRTKTLLFGRPNNFISLHSNTDALHLMTEYAHRNGISQIFAPKVTSANKVIAKESDFSKEIVCNDIVVYYGIAADGAVLPPHSAFFIASADCPTLVLQSAQGEVVAMHAGRQCLLDASRMTDGSQYDYESESVVRNALRFLHRDCKPIYASVYCGIGTDYFSHPIEHHVYGDVNEALVKYVVKRWGRRCFGKDLTQGRLNLLELISMQLREAGVNEKNIWHDGACTYSDLLSPEQLMWWSHRRGDKGRNGILVMRLN